MLGAGLISEISYNVIFAGGSSLVQSMRVTCNTTNYCTLRVQGSELSPSDTYDVSVVASNIVGSGTTSVFPTGGWFVCHNSLPSTHVWNRLMSNHNE